MRIDQTHRRVKQYGTPGACRELRARTLCAAGLAERAAIHVAYLIRAKHECAG